MHVILIYPAIFKDFTLGDFIIFNSMHVRYKKKVCTFYMHNSCNPDYILPFLKILLLESMYSSSTSGSGRYPRDSPHNGNTETSQTDPT